MKNFLIIGLGDFGTALVSELRKLDSDLSSGDSEHFNHVYVFDKDQGAIERFKQREFDNVSFPEDHILEAKEGNEVFDVQELDGALDYLDANKIRIDHAVVCVNDYLSAATFCAIELAKHGIAHITIRLHESNPAFEKSIQTLLGNKNSKCLVEYIIPESDVALTEAVEILSDYIDDFLPFDELILEPDDSVFGVIKAAKAMQKKRGIFKFRFRDKDGVEDGIRRLSALYDQKKRHPALPIPLFFADRDDSGAITYSKDGTSFDKDHLDKDSVMYFFGSVKQALRLDRLVNGSSAKTFVVCGLGRYGSELCRNLLMLGKYKELLAIDEDPAKVDAVSQMGVSLCRAVDCSKIEELNQIGISSDSFDPERKTKNPFILLKRAWMKAFHILPHVRHAIISLGSDEKGQESAIQTYLNFSRVGFEHITVRIDNDDSGIRRFFDEMNPKDKITHDTSLSVDGIATKNLAAQIQSDSILDWRPLYDDENCNFGVATLDLSAIRVYHANKANSKDFFINDGTMESDRFDKSSISKLFKDNGFIGTSEAPSLSGLAFDGKTWRYMVRGEFKDIVKLDEMIQLKASTDWCAEFAGINLAKLLKDISNPEISIRASSLHANDYHKDLVKRVKDDPERDRKLIAALVSSGKAEIETIDGIKYIRAKTTNK